MQSYVDSYFIVLESLNLLLDLGNNIELRYLTNSLHEVIQQMYYRGNLRFFNSCLKETLENAFGRFSELGVCISQVFQSHTGHKTIFISCTPDKRPLVKKYMELLSKLTSGEKSNRGLREISEMVENAIIKAQGPMAKL